LLAELVADAEREAQGPYRRTLLPWRDGAVADLEMVKGESTERASLG
jgi:hypothetical protein